ncbi:MAG TPA: amino acid ABC transporter permease [Bordetella sp.]
MTFDFMAVLASWPMLLAGLGWTILLTAVATVLGVFLAIVCAWGRVYGSTLVRWIVGIYVELIRNTPFIIQLFFVFFGLPGLGIKLTPAAASIIAIVLNLGAYAAEILRAGIEATPRGQIEAGYSLALTPTQVFTRVVLPPALKHMWPSLVGQVIIVMLGTAVCGQISMDELSYAANLIQTRTYRAFEAYIIVAVIYLALSMSVRRLLTWLGERFFFGRSAVPPAAGAARRRG